MRCAIYARVSTTDQNCEMQLRELRDYIQRRGWEPAAEYVDTGWSGTKASRPQLDRLMADARAHRFDCVLVWKLDRFGRSVVHLSQSLGDLRSWGVRFIAVTQSIDTDQANPTSNLLLNILAAIAEFEREMIVERVKAGVKEAKRKGKHCGRPKKVFPRGRALELREQGMSWSAVASELGVPISTVRDALRAV